LNDAPPAPSASQTAPQTASAPLPDGLAQPRRNRAVLALSLALTVAVLDSSSATVALPAIARAFGVASDEVVWLVNAYNLVVVCMLLPMSALAERIGFKRLFTGGLTLFVVASLASALSPSLAVLLAARIAQGLASAAIFGIFGGFMRNIYPTRLLGKGLGLNAMIVGLMSVLGPTIGSAILAVASWPWVFAATVPVTLAALAYVPALPDLVHTRSPFDWASAVLNMATLALLILGIGQLAARPWLALLLLLAAAGVGRILLARLRRQTRAQIAPLVPIDLLRIRAIAFAVAASAFFFAAQTGAFVAMPFYLHHVMARDTLTVGVLLSAWPLGAAIMAPISGRLSERHSAALLCAIGAGAMALGMGWLLWLSDAATNAAILLGMAVAGLGFGCFQTPNNRAMLSAAPRARSSAAGGLQATTRVFGQSLGTALATVAFGVSATHGATVALALCTVCALGALAVNVVRLRAGLQADVADG